MRPTCMQLCGWLIRLAMSPCHASPNLSANSTQRNDAKGAAAAQRTLAQLPRYHAFTHPTSVQVLPRASACTRTSKKGNIDKNTTHPAIIIVI